MYEQTVPLPVSVQHRRLTFIFTKRRLVGREPNTLVGTPLITQLIARGCYRKRPSIAQVSLQVKTRKKGNSCHWRYPSLSQSPTQGRAQGFSDLVLMPNRVQNLTLDSELDYRLDCKPFFGVSVGLTWSLRCCSNVHVPLVQGMFVHVVIQSLLPGFARSKTHLMVLQKFNLASLYLRVM